MSPPPLNECLVVVGSAAGTLLKMLGGIFLGAVGVLALVVAGIPAVEGLVRLWRRWI